MVGPACKTSHQTRNEGIKPTLQIQDLWAKSNKKIKFEWLNSSTPNPGQTAVFKLAWRFELVEVTGVSKKVRLASSLTTKRDLRKLCDLFCGTGYELKDDSRGIIRFKSDALPSQLKCRPKKVTLSKVEEASNKRTWTGETEEPPSKKQKVLLLTPFAHFIETSHDSTLITEVREEAEATRRLSLPIEELWDHLKFFKDHLLPWLTHMSVSTKFHHRVN